jgi:hypothetical protein
MARVAGCFHHRHGHPGIPDLIQSKFRQRASDAQLLVVRIYGDHVDFSYAVFRVAQTISKDGAKCHNAAPTGAV